MLMHSHLKKVVTKVYKIKSQQDTLRKRSGQDRNPTPLAKGARIAYNGKTNPVPASLYMVNAQLGPTDLIWLT